MNRNSPKQKKRKKKRILPSLCLPLLFLFGVTERTFDKRSTLKSCVAAVTCDCTVWIYSTQVVSVLPPCWFFIVVDYSKAITFPFPLHISSHLSERKLLFFFFFRITPATKVLHPSWDRVLMMLSVDCISLACVVTSYYLFLCCLCLFSMLMYMRCNLQMSPNS